MENAIKDLLLIDSLSLSRLIEDYRLFFLSLLPSIFILAIIIEYFDRLEPFDLVKRAFISILILTSVTRFYHGSIEASMDAANEILLSQKDGNILLKDMIDGVGHWENIKYADYKKDFFKDGIKGGGIFKFIKYHLFDSFINDGFTITIYFLTKICFLILKVIYSLIYYLGYGLIGIPCLIYIFPSMGNVLRGALLSFVWCLIIPHILVFILSLIGSEINKGYIHGHIIGGSMMGTALLFILTLFLAFTPLIGTMILTGAGISSAGGVIASIGSNYIMNLPKNGMNTLATVIGGGSLGPKGILAAKAVKGGFKVAGNASGSIKNKFNKGSNNQRNDFNSSNFKGNSSSDINHSKKSSNVNNAQKGSSDLQGSHQKNPTNNKKYPTFSNTQESRRGGDNAKLSKYSRVINQSKKTNDNHNDYRSEYKRTYSSNRGIYANKNKR